MAKNPLTRYRISLGVFIIGLALSGLTAFPLLHELSILTSLLGIDDPARYASYVGSKYWIAYVAFGLRQTYASFPFVGYGTDWLAFGHLTIALFFLGPWIAPRRNAWVLYCGLVACVGVIPLALICGPIRGIPFYWSLIDCSFGILGSLPLLYCVYLTPKLSNEHPREKTD
ncbi:MAG: hypothetical protein ABI443_09975 [Chthoniobacterales bacterium]